MASGCGSSDTQIIAHMYAESVLNHYKFFLPPYYKDFFIFNRNVVRGVLKTANEDNGLNLGAILSGLLSLSKLLCETCKGKTKRISNCLICVK